jgi:hypothetical protein
MIETSIAQRHDNDRESWCGRRVVGLGPNGTHIYSWVPCGLKGCDRCLTTLAHDRAAPIVAFVKDGNNVWVQTGVSPELRRRITLRTRRRGGRYLVVPTGEGDTIVTTTRPLGAPVEHDDPVDVESIIESAVQANGEAFAGTNQGTISSSRSWGRASHVRETRAHLDPIDWIGLSTVGPEVANEVAEELGVKVSERRDATMRLVAVVAKPRTPEQRDELHAKWGVIPFDFVAERRRFRTRVRPSLDVAGRAKRHAERRAA